MTNKELKEKFGIRLGRLRENRAMTQEDLAGASGLSADFIGMIERGLRQPTVVTLVKLANGLGIPAPQLLDLEEEFDWQKMVRKGGKS